MGEPFRRWRRAVATLRAAEFRGEPYPLIVLLSAEVIRTRNEATVDRLQAGWPPPDDVVRHLAADEQLLLEKDDADGVSTGFAEPTVGTTTGASR